MGAKTLYDICLSSVSGFIETENIHNNFESVCFNDLPVTILADLVYYLTPHRLFISNHLLRTKGISVDKVWSMHYRRRRWFIKCLYFDDLFKHNCSNRLWIEKYMEKHFHCLVQYKLFPSDCLKQELKHMLTSVQHYDSSIAVNQGSFPLYIQDLCKIESFVPFVRTLSLQARDCEYFTCNNQLLQNFKRNVTTLRIHSLRTKKQVALFETLTRCLLNEGHLKEVQLVRVNIDDKNSFKKLLWLIAGQETCDDDIDGNEMNNYSLNHGVNSQDTQCSINVSDIEETDREVIFTRSNKEQMQLNSEESSECCEDSLYNEAVKTVSRDGSSCDMEQICKLDKRNSIYQSEKKTIHCYPNDGDNKRGVHSFSMIDYREDGQNGFFTNELIKLLPQWSNLKCITLCELLITDCTLLVLICHHAQQGRLEEVILKHIVLNNSDFSLVGLIENLLLPCPNSDKEFPLKRIHIKNVVPDSVNASSNNLPVLFQGCEELDIQGIRLSKVGMQHITSLISRDQALRHLVLSYIVNERDRKVCMLDVLKTVQVIGLLESLDLSGNYFSEEAQHLLPETISCLKNLKFLSLRNTCYTSSLKVLSSDSFVTAVANHGRLYGLNLAYNGIGENIEQILERLFCRSPLSNLRRLDLSYNRCSADPFINIGKKLQNSNFGRQCHLEIFDISFNRIGDKINDVKLLWENLVSDLIYQSMDFDFPFAEYESQM